MNKTLSPLISIIVPVYNVEEYLSYCVDTLLTQTYTNLEILLIDDGSTDSSLQKCQEYAMKDTRCKVFHHENHGIGYTRNIGLKYANGKYIGFVDSDDYVHPDYINILYKSIISGNYDFSMINYRSTAHHHETVQLGGSNVREFSQKELFNHLFNGPLPIPCNLNDTAFAVVWNKLYKKEIVDGLLFPSNTHAEDLEFNTKVFLRCQKAIFTDNKLYFYFQRVNSIVHKPVDKSVVNDLKSYLRSLQFIPKDKKEFRAVCLTKLYKKCFSTRYQMGLIKEEKTFNTVYKDIKEQTFQEMIYSRYISFHLKFILVTFSVCPFLYKLFVSYNERRAKSTTYRGKNFK